MRTIEIKGDGAHWGLSDWYPYIEKQMIEALEAGDEFDTGWYASKKEIASGRITLTHEGGANWLRCEASVSDDFDTEGRYLLELNDNDGEKITIERIVETIDKAFDLAHEDKKDHEPFEGFSILQEGSWIETYLRCIDPIHEVPPGDNYVEWGWQNETSVMSEADRKALQEIFDAELDPTKIDGKEINGYTIKLWD